MVANTWYKPPELTAPGVQSDERIEIGVVAPNYGLEHLTYLMQVPGYRHVKLRRLPVHRLERNGTFWDKSPILLRAPVRLVHTFNHIPLNGPPFVLSVESELPFYLGRHRAWQHKIGHRILASERCRAILAMSDTAGELAKQKFDLLGLPEVVSKIQTFRGAVLTSSSHTDRQYSQKDDPLKLLFVGADGLRKGIAPLLDAIEMLRKDGANIELTVVSSMLNKSYAIADANTQAEVLTKKMEAFPWVTHLRSLPYDQVRAQMGVHDIFAFPTLDETLGWVVIEAAMEEMGTIGTNVFALPELIDDGVSGRIVELPLNESKRWVGLFQTDRHAAQDAAYAAIYKGLVTMIGEVLADRSLVGRWGKRAKSNLAGLYDPTSSAKQLSEIYDAALKSVVRKRTSDW